MTIHDALILSAIGLIVGVISGMLGIGGGLLVIPSLMFFMGFGQKMAIGTSMAMLLPPIGIFAFLTYWQAGNVDLPAAAVLAVAFACGAWLGALIVTAGWVPDAALRGAFALLLLYVAGNLLFRSDSRTRAAFETLGMIALFGIAFVVVGLVRKRWDRQLDALRMYERKLKQAMGPDFEI